MRIATWNVNSLKARQEKVDGLARARRARRPAHAGDQAGRRRRPGDDVRDGAATTSSTTARVAGTAWRSPSARASALDDVVTNFGDGPVRDSGPGCRGGRSARRTSTRRTRPGWCRRRGRSRRSRRRPDPGGQPVRPERAGRRFAVLRRASCAGSTRLRRWLGECCRPGRRAGDRWRLQHRADRRRRLGCRPRSTAAPTSPSRSARRSGRSLEWGLVDAYRAQARPSPGRFTWWDYRAGNFHKNLGMRIDHLLVDRAGRRPRRLGRDRPRGAQGPADPLGPRPAGDRPRDARPPVRTRLGGRPVADRRPHSPGPPMTGSATWAGPDGAEVALDGTGPAPAESGPVGCPP